VILDGAKTWVANGEIAGLFLVFAEGPGGTEAYLVPQDTPGLTVGYREPTLGLRSVAFNTLYLEDCRVPQANRIGEPGGGIAMAQQAQNRMAVALAAAGLGVSENALEVAAQYATERVQFGVPIAKKQAIQNYVAEAMAEVEALRYLVYHAAWTVDRGGDFSFDASVVKAFGARVARSVDGPQVPRCPRAQHHRRADGTARLSNRATDLCRPGLGDCALVTGIPTEEMEIWILRFLQNTLLCAG